MFTEKEKRLLLKNEYFNVLRDTEDLIEVQSKNTGHCWAFKKSSKDTRNKVIVHHKHKITDAYYHKHLEIASVAMAITAIKNHDKSVLEGNH